MDLDFVETFYWVAMLENFAAAAEQVHVEPASVAARIKALENELDTKLFDRQGRPPRLTPAGVRFLAHAKRLIKIRNEIKASIGSVRQRPVALRIGAIESVLHSWLIPWLDQLRKEHPGIELELTVETTPMLTELVRRGKLDLALAALPELQGGVHTRALPSLPMEFVGKRGLHKERHYTLPRLAQGELLTFQRNSQPNSELHRLLNEAGIKTARVHAISSISAMVRLVEAGFGVATLPRAAVEPIARSAGLRLLPCDAKLVPLPVHASWREGPSANTIGTIIDSLVAFTESTKPAPQPSKAKRNSRVKKL